MNQEDYKLIWSRLWGESVELMNRRTELEMQLNDVKAKLQNVEQALAHLEPLAGISSGETVQGLGMTDAIRVVLKKSNERMSAGDVQKALTSRGFDFGAYSSPMSSIYTVLNRLADDNSNEIIREKEENRVFYRWQQKDEFAENVEISDDDIPF